MSSATVSRLSALLFLLATACGGPAPPPFVEPFASGLEAALNEDGFPVLATTDAPITGPFPYTYRLFAIDVSAACESDNNLECVEAALLKLDWLEIRDPPAAGTVFRVTGDEATCQASLRRLGGSHLTPYKKLEEQLQRDDLWGLYVDCVPISEPSG